MLIGWSVEAGPMETHYVLRTDSYTLAVCNQWSSKQNGLGVKMKYSVRDCNCYYNSCLSQCKLNLGAQLNIYVCAHM